MGIDEKRTFIFEYCKVNTFSVVRLKKSIKYLLEKGLISKSTYNKYIRLYNSINTNENAWILLIILMYNIISNNDNNAEI